jgi:hypothetical protein
MMTDVAPVEVELTCQAMKAQFEVARPFQRHFERCHIAERASDV